MLAHLMIPLALGVGDTARGREMPPEPLGASVCGMPDGWRDVEEQQPQYVVFGELHGTREGPEFIGNLACALASRNQRVLVGIEQNATDDAALQLAWKSSADEFGQALSQVGWAGREDGVASEAMFAMLVRLHGLKERGFPINVVAFNGYKDEGQAKRFAHLPGQGPHEAAQAQNIADAASSGDYDRILVLVGSFHARKDSRRRGSDLFDPMARRLAQSGKTLTLNMRYADGSSWNCILKPGVGPAPGQPVRSDDLDCGHHPTRGNGEFDRPPFVELDPNPAEGMAGSFDGFFWVGPISGSPPLRDAK